jgi:drug/metabolite transporter (DMT)-like permease
MLGVGAACGSGVAYALLGVVIRSVVTNRMSVLMTLVLVTLVGVLTLGPLSLGTLGLSGILSTEPEDFGFMMLAGVFNAVAFLALTKALQLVPVVYVNALNATQATMGALAGVMIFAEPSSWWLWLGVALTAVGLLLMRRPRRVPLNTVRTELTSAAAAPCGADA